MRMNIDDILQYFQSELEKDFGYEDDAVIDQVQVSLEELRKAKMDVPPKPKTNEEPTLPFGLEIEPSIEQILKGIHPESVDEHFKRNPHKGKAGYLRKRGLTGSATPEMSRSQTDSMQSSRLSEYSIDDKSSYYDTAANSRLSLADFTSMQSSRTSYAEGSEFGSNSLMRHTGGTPLANDVSSDVEGDVDETTMEHPSRDTTIENIAGELGELKTPSVHSDYDNLDHTLNGVNEVNSDSEQYQMRQIPVSKSDGYIVEKRSADVWIDRGEDKVVTTNTTLSREDTLRLSQQKIQRMKNSTSENGSASRFVSTVQVQQEQHYNGYLNDIGTSSSPQGYASSNVHSPVSYRSQIQHEQQVYH